MAKFPQTLVCAGCGSWLTLDVKRTGSLVVLLLCAVTLGLAYFSLYFLILLPLYFVLSMGPLLRFSVALIEKRRADIWTINRRTGALRPLNEAEKAAERDVMLSHKLGGLRAFRPVPLSKSRIKAAHCPSQDRPGSDPKKARPKFNVDDLPTGLPH